MYLVNKLVLFLYFYLTECFIFEKSTHSNAVALKSGLTSHLHKLLFNYNFSIPVDGCNKKGAIAFKINCCLLHTVYHTVDKQLGIPLKFCSLYKIKCFKI